MNAHETRECRQAGKTHNDRWTSHGRQKTKTRRALAKKGTNIINKDQNLASLAAYFRIVFKHRYLVLTVFIMFKIYILDIFSKYKDI